MFDFKNLTDIQAETLEQLSDVVGDTPIKGFEDISEGANEIIADYIRDTIPGRHLESCEGIAYNPESKTFQTHRDALGAYYPGGRNIEIASETRFENAEDMLDTIVHEIGHNAYSNLEENSPEAIKKWEQMYEDTLAGSGSGFGFVSEYAKTSEFEDFAESYKAYIRDPELLKFMSEEKYAFMKYDVFEGQEYIRDSIAVSREIPSSHLEGLLAQSPDIDISSMSRDELLDAIGRNIYSSDLIYSEDMSDGFSRVTGGGNIDEFAHLYSSYVMNGHDLLQNNPDQYEFMRDNIFNGMEFIDYVSDEDGEVILGDSSKISDCNQLDYYASCNQLDIIAVSPKRGNEKKYEDDERLNPKDKPDALFLSGCAAKCVRCEVKASDCTSH